MKKFLRSFFFLLITAFLVTACTQEKAVADTAPGQIWIDSPLDQAVLPLNPVAIIFHGAHTNGIQDFEVKINGEVAGTIPAISAGENENQTLFYGEHLWIPNDPGKYLIQVRWMNPNGEYSAPAAAEVFVFDDHQNNELFGESDEPAEEADSGELGDCFYTAIKNLFCREGPGRVYSELDTFLEGESAKVIGKSEDGFFSYVIGPNYGETCAVPNAEDFGKLNGGCEDLPIIPDPPTPTPTPVPTSPPRPTPTPCASTRGCP